MGEEEEDLDKVKVELREAFRLYDKEGKCEIIGTPQCQHYPNTLFFSSFFFLFFIRERLHYD